MQPTAAEKVHERRLRRAALRKGLHLRKSSKLDPDHPEFGKWWVVTTPAKYPEAWRSLGQELTHRDGITLEAAAAFVEAYDTATLLPERPRSSDRTPECAGSSPPGVDPVEGLQFVVKSSAEAR